MSFTHFANKIKALRKARGITQFALAEMIDRSSEAISQIERGKTFPNFESLELLSKALEVPIAEFFDVPSKTRTPKTQRMLNEVQAVASTLDETLLEIALIQIKALQLKL